MSTFFSKFTLFWKKLRRNALWWCVVFNKLRSNALWLCIVLHKMRDNALWLWIVLHKMRSNALWLCVVLHKMRGNALWLCVAFGWHLRDPLQGDAFKMHTPLSSRALAGANHNTETNPSPISHILVSGMFLWLSACGLHVCLASVFQRLVPGRISYSRTFASWNGGACHDPASFLLIFVLLPVFMN